MQVFISDYRFAQRVFNIETASIECSSEAEGFGLAVLLNDKLKDNNIIEELILKNQKFGEIGATALAGLIKTNRMIKILDISGNDINERGMLAIAEALEDNNTLEEINLFGEAALKPEIIARLKQIAFRHPQLKKMFVRDNGNVLEQDNLNNKKNEILGKFASGTDYYQFSQGPINNHTIALIRRSLSLKTIKYIIFKESTLAPAEDEELFIGELIRLLKENPQLKSLDLSSLRLSYASIHALWDAASDTMEHLLVQIKNDAANFGKIIDIIAERKRKRIKADLKRIWQNDWHLRSLDTRHWLDQGFVCLMQALSRNQCITHLGITIKNDDQLAKLKALLKNHPSIRSVTVYPPIDKKDDKQSPLSLANLQSHFETNQKSYPSLYSFEINYKNNPQIGADERLLSHTISLNVKELSNLSSFLGALFSALIWLALYPILSNPLGDYLNLLDPDFRRYASTKSKIISTLSPLLWPISPLYGLILGFKNGYQNGMAAITDPYIGDNELTVAEKELRNNNSFISLAIITAAAGIGAGAYFLFPQFVAFLPFLATNPLAWAFIAASVALFAAVAIYAIAVNTRDPYPPMPQIDNISSESSSPAKLSEEELKDILNTKVNNHPTFNPYQATPGGPEEMPGNPSENRLT